MNAGTMDGSGYNRPVTATNSDRTRLPEQRREYLSPAERGLREHQRVQKMLADAEAERIRERAEIYRRNEQRAAQAKAKQQAEANELLIDGEFATLTDREKAEAWAILVDSGSVTVERAAVIALEMKARRAVTVRSGRERIAAVKALCTDAMWQNIQETVAGSSQPRWKDGWTAEEIESGEAHERTFRQLYRRRV